MKKQLLLFAFSALALTSCEKDDNQGYDLDTIKGEWKISKIEIISGKDNKTVISSQTISGCDAKSTTLFRTDYSVSYTTYTLVGTNCQVSGTGEGTFTYNTDTKDLGITYKGEDPDQYKVTVLSSSELKLMQLPEVDYNADTIKDHMYISFKR